MKPSKLAFIGARGHWGQVLRQLAEIPSLRLVALADGGDSVAPIAAWCRDNGHLPRVFDDYRAMLEETKPDFVVALGRPRVMPEIAHHLLDAGYPFVMEKPIGLDATQVRGVAEKTATVDVLRCMRSFSVIRPSPSKSCSSNSQMMPELGLGIPLGSCLPVAARSS